MITRKGYVSFTVLLLLFCPEGFYAAFSAPRSRRLSVLTQPGRCLVQGAGLCGGAWAVWGCAAERAAPLQLPQLQAGSEADCPAAQGPSPKDRQPAGPVHRSCARPILTVSLCIPRELRTHLCTCVSLAQPKGTILEARAASAVSAQSLL